ncbi:MAG: DUF2062 domain-containing protein [Terracidiphilus sp.]|jgi:uncharacterized protein (DUF2062 family)
MGLREKMGNFPAVTKRIATLWLSQGISPRRLALTLALGFSVGCIPLLGIPTVLCTALALALRLNLPAIQAANCASTPLQLALIVPFVRLGRWLMPTHSAAASDTRALLHLPLLHLATWAGGIAGQALLAWLLVAVPAVALITLGLTRLLRRFPALDTAEAGD